MIDIDLKPDTKKLRQFGWIGLIGFGVFGFLVAHKTGTFDEPDKGLLPVVFWALAVVCPLLSLTAPKGLLPIYLLLMIIAIPIGFVISNAILILIFFIMITPLALWFRLIGRDELRRKKKSSTSASHWIRCEESRGVASYYRQF